MKSVLAVLFALIAPGMLFAGGEVLIVADEFPAMQVLADQLKAETDVPIRIVGQTNLPANLSSFAAVLVYIHRDLAETAEKAFVTYTDAGGKLIVLHHSISSGKRKNRQWFSFLGVTLPEGDVSRGGYQWTEGVTLQIVNLAPDQFITTNRVSYPERVAFQSPAVGPETKTLPGFTLTDSEVYLNHVLDGPHTLLLGLKYTDGKTGRLFMQTHAGWFRPDGKGWIVYLMPGHSARDFENPAYRRIVVNAVLWKP